MVELGKNPTGDGKKGKQQGSNIGEGLLIRPPGRLMPGIPDGITGIA